MIEFQVIVAVFNLIFAFANFGICLWEHDTRTLVIWIVAFVGWFVAFCQLMIRINKGET